MDDSTPGPAPGPTLQGVLGYLNFSTGRPDARFHKQINDAWAALTGQGAAAPWQALHDWLRRDLDALHAANSAFQDAGQATGVLAAVFALLPEYRALKEKNRNIVTACADPHGFAMYEYFKNGTAKSTPGDSITEGIGLGRVTPVIETAEVDGEHQRASSSSSAR